MALGALATAATFVLVLINQKGTHMGHRTKRFFQWSGKMGERF